MEVKITFTSSVVIKCKDIKEAKEKWEELELYSNEAIKMGADYDSINSVERVDDGSYKNLENEFSNAEGGGLNGNKVERYPFHI